MTKIKMCGLSRICDIETVNELVPEYIGFVFAPKSRRYITVKKAEELKNYLNPNIITVGVFVNESPEKIRELLTHKIIDIAQLHGKEDENYIKNLRKLTNKPIIKAFSVNTEQNIIDAEKSSADYILLDSGSGGSGKSFDWSLIQSLKRQYFLAGGLNCDNIKSVVEKFKPYAVDVSSGIETDGFKDKNKMYKFVYEIRRKDEIE